MCPYFCENLSVVMYRKFRNVLIFKDFPTICPYFLGFRVCKYAILSKFHCIIIMHLCSCISYTAQLWQKEASDIPSKSGLLMFSYFT